MKQVEAKVNICFALLLGWTFQEKTNKWKWKLIHCFPITSPNANVFVIECILRNGKEGKFEMLQLAFFGDDLL